MLSSSLALPIVLLPLDSVYDAVRSSPLVRRRLTEVISALYSLWPRLTVGRLPVEFGLSVGTSRPMRRSVEPPPISWLSARPEVQVVADRVDVVDRHHGVRASARATSRALVCFVYGCSSRGSTHWPKSGFAPGLTSFWLWMFDSGWPAR